MKHRSYYPDTDLTRGEIERKFRALYNHNEPTGGPNCPPFVRKAKRIYRQIVAELDRDLEDENKKRRVERRRGTNDDENLMNNIQNQNNRRRGANDDENLMNNIMQFIMMKSEMDRREEAARHRERMELEERRERRNEQMMQMMMQMMNAMKSSASPSPNIKSTGDTNTNNNE